MLQLRKLSQQGILFKRIHSADFSKRGQTVNLEMKGGHMRFLILGLL